MLFHAKDHGRLNFQTILIIELAKMGNGIPKGHSLEIFNREGLGTVKRLEHRLENRTPKEFSPPLTRIAGGGCPEKYGDAKPQNQVVYDYDLSRGIFSFLMG